MSSRRGFRGLVSVVAKSGLALLLFVAMGTVGARLIYPGLTDAFLLQLRDGGVKESLNIARCLEYWIGSLGKMRWDASTGQWDFPQSIDSGTAPDLQARWAFHRGDFPLAIQGLRRLTDRGDVTRDRLFWLGLSYMRYAEQRNCLEALQSPTPPARVCTLPLGHLHAQRDGSREAAEVFSRMLDEGSGDRDLLQWLAGFSRLTLGEEAETLANPELGAFLELFYGETAQRARRAHESLVFEDRADQLGVAKLDAGKGVAVEDFDGDGDLDLVTGGTFDPLHYYENLSGRGFLEVTREVGLDGIRQSHIITTADYDNDGRLDLFVGSLFQRDRLLRNEGPAGFRDVTAVVGLDLEPQVLGFTWASSWGDIDLDGDLDLFVARWGVKVGWLGGVLASPRAESSLYLNEGGRFADATDAWGLREILRDQNFIGAAFGDADQDGDPDLYLSSPLQARSVLLRNEGGRFEVEQRFGAGFLAAFLDVDHDGQPEILHTGLADARTSTQKSVYGRKFGVPTSGRNLILRRTADRGWIIDERFFEDELPMGTMGSSFGDLDNDGCLDFYFGTGDPEPWFVLPNLMFKGRLEGRECVSGATNISMIQGFGSVQKGHGIVFFDFDDDGDQDIYSSLGGMWPGDRWPNQLFVNQSRLDRHWIKIRLRGRVSNRHGVGSMIRVVAGNAAGESIVRTYLMNQKTGFGSAPLVGHIGLLDATTIQRIEVDWPASRCRAQYPGELDQLNVLDEAACPELRSLPET